MAEELTEMKDNMSQETQIEVKKLTSCMFITIPDHDRCLINVKICLYMPMMTMIR